MRSTCSPPQSGHPILGSFGCSPGARHSSRLRWRPHTAVPAVGGSGRGPARCRGSRLRPGHRAAATELSMVRLAADPIAPPSVGADGYLTQPFSPRELVRRVRAMLRRSCVDAPTADTHRALGCATGQPGLVQQGRPGSVPGLTPDRRLPPAQLLREGRGLLPRRARPVRSVLSPPPDPGCLAGANSRR